MKVINLGVEAGKSAGTIVGLMRNTVINLS
jgi:hypothetical protein